MVVTVVACSGSRPSPSPNLSASAEATASAAPRHEARLVAIKNGLGVTVVNVAGDGVAPIGDVPKTFEFAWLDRHTLINLDLWGRDGNTVTVTRVVDGQLVETQTVSREELGDHAAISLGLTQSREVWLGTCASAYRLYGPALADPWATGEDGPCQGRHYVRVWPAPRQQQDQLPSGIVTAHRPPTVAAPSQYKLSTEKVAMEYRCDEGSGDVWCPYEITTSVCEGNGKRTRYPEPPRDRRTEDGGSHLQASNPRWVQDRPLLYEVTFHWCPDRNEPSCVKYLRPCDPKPLDEYAWLGGAQWASFVADPPTGDPGAVKGTWTFWDGETKLGTLRGEETLRAYPQ